MRMLGKLGTLAGAVLLLLPSIALAQASITGNVKDTSGAVLPGVTVEAASPVLIEKVKSTITDESESESKPDAKSNGKASEPRVKSPKAKPAK